MLSREAFVAPPALLDAARVRGAVPTAIAGADSTVAMESARRAVEAGLIEPCLIGDRRRMAEAAREIGWDLIGVRTIAVDDEHEAVRTAVALARGREVSALMKGQVHTDVLMRAVFHRVSGLREDRRISHVFHMTIPQRDGSLLITDAAVNVNPDVPTKLDIIRNAVGVAHALGNAEPRVAVLSATEQANDTVPSSVAAAEINRRAAQGEVTGAIVDGPLAFDNAISPQAAAIKGIDSPVAGKADILVVPNIETGNTLYKAMVFLMSATAAGIVVGARVPIILTSRADPPEARLASVALAALVSR